MSETCNNIRQHRNLKAIDQNKGKTKVKSLRVWEAEGAGCL